MSNGENRQDKTTKRNLKRLMTKFKQSFDKFLRVYYSFFRLCPLSTCDPLQKRFQCAQIHYVKEKPFNSVTLNRETGTQEMIMSHTTRIHHTNETRR